MERMVEVVEEDYHSQHHFLSYSPWNHQAVFSQIAQEADRHLGGYADSALIIDESGHVKKGDSSVGVGRQWCGRLGKVDNCQVGVYAALSHESLSTLIDERLFLPEDWIKEPTRCQKAKIPQSMRIFRGKCDLALEMVRNNRQNGVGFCWVEMDSFYGRNTQFLRALQEDGERFVADVPEDQGIYLEDPAPYLPMKFPRKTKRPKRLKTEQAALSVKQWTKEQSQRQWKKIKIRDNQRGIVVAEFLHQLVWLWDKKEGQAHQWHLIVRREIEDPEEIKYSLSNAEFNCSLATLAQRQAQSYFVERTLQNAKSELGMSDYQVRLWKGWHHHMTLVSMAMLFVLEEQFLQKNDCPLLSYYDVVVLLNFLLPKRKLDLEVLIEQMLWRHCQRDTSIQTKRKKILKALYEN